ncbi:MAG: hemerythrin domain-containing protein [Armatimonadetes bacterium]|nr:hemerythrin domain-containing protein [Armatimonadota bacterium]
MKQLELPEPIRCMCTEHQMILSRLESLRSAANAGAADVAQLAHLATELLSILNAHIYKEENLLFPAVKTALGNREDALDILEAEHSQVTELRDILASLAEEPRPENVSDYRSRIANFASTAAEMMRPHIFKEDHVLYPLAATIVPKEQLTRID